VSVLGAETVRVGEPLRGAELGALAERLVSLPEPLDATTVELRDGRALRVTGVAAHEDDPAILLIEDVTAERRRERVVREFVRNAAHQLRTPLAGIVAAVEVLQSGAKDVPADRDRFLGHVAEHATRLTRVARALLMLARAESDFEPNIVDGWRKIGPRIGAGLQPKRQPRQQRFAQMRLMRREFRSLAPPVKLSPPARAVRRRA